MLLGAASVWWDAGDAVIRCVRLVLGTTGVSAAASITDDQTDGSNYDVSVTKVRLMAYNS